MWSDNWGGLDVGLMLNLLLTDLQASTNWLSWKFEFGRTSVRPSGYIRSFLVSPSNFPHKPSVAPKSSSGGWMDTSKPMRRWLWIYTWAPDGKLIYNENKRFLEVKLQLKVHGYVTRVKGWTIKVYSISSRLHVNTLLSFFFYLNNFGFRNKTSFGNIRRYLATTACKVVNLVLRCTSFIWLSRAYANIILMYGRLTPNIGLKNWLPSHFVCCQTTSYFEIQNSLRKGRDINDCVHDVSLKTEILWMFIPWLEVRSYMYDNK